MSPAGTLSRPGKLEITGAGIKLREGESGFTFGLWLKELEGEGGVDCD